MKKLNSNEIIKYLNDNKIIVKINNKKYTRNVKTSINDKKYIVVNNQEMEV